MYDKSTKNLLKMVLQWDSKDECTEEFLYNIRGKMAFDLDVEFPLLEGIDHHDMTYKIKELNFVGKCYNISFSEKFKKQIHKHYPEHLV